MDEDAYRNIAVKLKEKGLKFQIIIKDVHKLMDEQNLVESTRGMASDFYSKYHPLDEVITKKKGIYLESEQCFHRMQIKG